MRLSCLLLGVLVAGAVASTAAAADLDFYFDVRADSAAILAPAAPYTRGQSLMAGTKKDPDKFAPDAPALNGGGAGDAAVLRLSPRMPTLPEGTHGAHWTWSKKTDWVDNSVGSAYLYVDVADRTGDAEVLSSFGVDMDVVKGGAAGAGNPIEGLDWAYNGAAFDGTRAETITADGVGGFTIADIKAVKVPVSDPGSGPVFDATDAIIEGPAQLIGQLDIVAGEWNKGLATPADSIYGVKMAVNGLLITRVYDNAAGGPTPESIAFGYAAGAPEAADNTGDQVGATSATDDLTIILQTKGDFNNDGNVNTQDLDALSFGMEWMMGNEFAATEDAKPRLRGKYLGDFNNDGTVNTQDISNAARNGIEQTMSACFGSCPCP